MYLAFIHIGRYDIKARRHLACVQNGITQLGDWRMETWQLALRARYHVSIRQSPSLCNAILNTCPCLLAINQYWSYKPHSNFKQHEIFWSFSVCPSNDTFDKNKKSWCRYWGSTAKKGSLLGIKQRLIPTHNQPHLSRLCANFAWALNTIYSTGYLPCWGIQRYDFFNILVEL